MLYKGLRAQYTPSLSQYYYCYIIIIIIIKSGSFESFHGMTGGL